MSQTASGDKTESTNVKFYCPEDGCCYHEASEKAKFFRKKLFLHQHVANQHREKQFNCSVCGKKYAFAWQLTHHEKYCNQMWSCLSCDKTYSERLSLVMHCKRHGHTLPEEAKGWSDSQGKRKNKRYKELPSSNSQPLKVLLVPIHVYVPTPVVERIERPILPKETVVPETVSTATQTTETRCPRSFERPTRVHKTTKSQTGTQTEKKKSSSSQCNAVRTVRRRTKSNSHEVQSETVQTQTLESVLSGGPSVRTASTSVCSELFSLPMSSTAAGTSMEDELIQPWNTIPCNEMSVQTDECNFPFEGYSTIETQTNPTDMTYNLLNSEDDLLAFMEMNDIETQTQWNNDGTTQTDHGLTDFPHLNFDILSQE